MEEHQIRLIVREEIWKALLAAAVKNLDRCERLEEKAAAATTAVKDVVTKVMVDTEYESMRKPELLKPNQTI